MGAVAMPISSCRASAGVRTASACRSARPICAARLAALRTLATAPARSATRAAAAGHGEGAASGAAAGDAQAAGPADGAADGAGAAQAMPPRLQQEVGLLVALDVEYTHLAPQGGGRHVSLPAEVCAVDATGRVLLYSHCNPLGEPAGAVGAAGHGVLELDACNVRPCIVSVSQPLGRPTLLPLPANAATPGRGQAGAAAVAPSGRRAAAAVGAGAAAERGAGLAGGAAGGARPGGAPPAQGFEGAGAGAPRRGHPGHPALPVGALRRCLRALGSWRAWGGRLRGSHDVRGGLAGCGSTQPCPAHPPATAARSELQSRKSAGQGRRLRDLAAEKLGRTIQRSGVRHSPRCARCSDWWRQCWQCWR